MLHNTKKGYGIIAITLHWIVAVMIISLLSVGLYMVDLPPSDDKWYIYGIHKAIGVLLLTLVCIRGTYRLLSIQPTLPETIPALQISVAKANWDSMY